MNDKSFGDREAMMVKSVLALIVLLVSLAGATPGSAQVNYHFTITSAQLGICDQYGGWLTWTATYNVPPYTGLVFNYTRNAPGVTIHVPDASDNRRLKGLGTISGTAVWGAASQYFFEVYPQYTFNILFYVDSGSGLAGFRRIEVTCSQSSDTVEIHN
jgi:hypothetical protein